MDSETSIHQLKKTVLNFCEERDWYQYHNSKDLSIGIITEASELLEHFRFKSKEQIGEMLADPQRRQMIGNELADVFFFVLCFAQMNDFDLSDELLNKMEINGRKYPVNVANGSNKKYTEL